MLERLLRNKVAKIASLCAALLLFWYVQANRTITRDIQVRIEPLKLPDSLVLASKVPAYLNVQIRGPREVMDFPVADLKIRIHADRPRPGDHVPFESELTPRLPAGVEARYSKRVFLDIDREAQRDIPIEPMFNAGHLPGGLRPGYFWIEPPALRLRGPARLLNRIAKVRTRLIDIRMDRAGVFEAYPSIVGLPDFALVVSGQEELRFRMNILPVTGVGPEPGEKEVTIEGISSRCLNGLSAFDLEHEPVQAVVVLPAGQPMPLRNQFEAVFFCPVDAKTGDPVALSQVPVRIQDRRGRSYLAVRLVTPAKTDVRFHRTARTLIQTGRGSFTKPKDK